MAYSLVVCCGIESDAGDKHKSLPLSGTMRFLAYAGHNGYSYCARKDLTALASKPQATSSCSVSSATSFRFAALSSMS